MEYFYWHLYNGLMCERDVLVEKLFPHGFHSGTLVDKVQQLYGVDPEHSERESVQIMPLIPGPLLEDEVSDLLRKRLLNDGRVHANQLSAQ